MFGNLGVVALTDEENPFRNLVKVDLSRCGLEGEEGGTAVSSLLRASRQSLETLRLAGNVLGNAGLAALIEAEAFPSLVSIDLAGCCLVGAEAGRQVSKLTGACRHCLESLKLRGNKGFGQEGLVELRPLPSLQDLNVADCGLEGVDTLRHLYSILPSSFTRCVLWGNKLPLQDFKRLFDQIVDT
eukprot:Platyproteum_vivax@DN6502_c0_g1_i2.p1